MSGARIGAWLEEMCFPQVPAARLAAVRIATGGFALYQLWIGWGSFAQIARTAPDQWRPVGPMRLLSGPLAPEVFDGWSAVQLALALCFLLGLGWRVLAPICAISTVCFFAYRTSWGGVLHGDNLFCLHMVCLALGPAASALSLDARIAARWPERLRWARWGPLPEVCWWYGWNLRLIAAVTVICYLLAGVAKLVSDPAGWPTGQSLLDQIGNDALYKELISAKGAAPLVPWVYQHPGWLVVPAVGTLIIEVGAPLALLDRRLGWLWSVATCSMHHGILLIMGISFPYPLSALAFAAFFPLDVWAGAAGQAARRLLVRLRDTESL